MGDAEPGKQTSRAINKAHMIDHRRRVSRGDARGMTPLWARCDSSPMRQRVTSGSPFEPRFGFSRAVRIGDRVLVSGTAPIWPDGGCIDDATVQATRCFEIIAAALSEAGASMDDVVRTRIFLTSAADADAVGAVHGKVFSDVRPVATMVVVAALLDARWKVEIEAEAVIG
jgi:enamine deaminase RidA (YjgF/YER057c/UK114 family)